MRVHQLITKFNFPALGLGNLEFSVPTWARKAIFYWNVVMSGTTPLATCQLTFKDPTSGKFVLPTAMAFANKAVTAFQAIQTDGGATTAGVWISAQANLPLSMRAEFTFDFITTDENYDNTLSVDWIDDY